VDQATAFQAREEELMSTTIFWLGVAALLIFAVVLALIILCGAYILKIFFGWGAMDDDSATDQPKKRVESG